MRANRCRLQERITLPGARNDRSRPLSLPPLTRRRAPLGENSSIDRCRDSLRLAATRMHDRLDWKLWNLFLAMVPPAALYATLVYARQDMDELIAKDKDFLVSAVISF